MTIVRLMLFSFAFGVAAFSIICPTQTGEAI